MVDYHIEDSLMAACHHDRQLLRDVLPDGTVIYFCIYCGAALTEIPKDIFWYVYGGDLLASGDEIE